MTSIDYSKKNTRKPKTDPLWYVKNVQKMKDDIQEAEKAEQPAKKPKLSWTQCGYCDMKVPWQTMKLHFFKRHQHQNLISRQKD